MDASQNISKSLQFWKYVQVLFSALGILVVIDHVFMLNIFGKVLIFTSSYLYSLLTIYLSLVFIIYPAKRNTPRTKVPWYDALAFLLIVGITVVFIFHGRQILTGSWQFMAPMWASVCSIILLFLILEATRRVTGILLAIICFVFMTYPMFAGSMPGLLQGQQFSFLETVGFHILSQESVLGIPMNVVGNLVVGFIIFGSFLMVTGGGKFFYNFSMALFGHQRGGPAKVAVVASGLFGSMSGSAVSNVVTTGTMTIPAMKRIGYPAAYAGAIEACASTGGMLMPPIMGTTAFIMAMFLNITYLQVVIAAIIPSVLYYMALFFQVDGYAAKHNMRGFEAEELPSLGKTLLQGWPYLLAFVVLIYLLVLRLEAQAPFYAAGVLWICAMLKKETRPSLQTMTSFLSESGKVLANLVGILASIGLIMGAFIVTGVGHALSRELVQLAGGNGYLLLIFGAIACFFLGMGMTVTAAYIFLAIVMGPALESLGFNILAVHLFILYYAVTSNLTPPVAITAFVAAGVAEAPAFKTGFLSMRLGIIMYIVPFFFVLRPELVLQGPLLDCVIPFLTCVIGIFLLAGGFEGYLTGFGQSLKWPLRIPLIAAGFMLIKPGWKTDIVAGILAAVVIVYLLIRKKTEMPKKAEIIS